MNKLIITALLATTAAVGVATPALAADVGVSVSISQPGVYGRVDIGRFPQPQVVVAQPIYVQRPVRMVQPPQPVYMWVPPGHRKNWRRHCGHYNACGVPVYFVQDQWYDQHVRHRGPDRGHDHDRDRGPGRDRDDRGPGHGKGKHRD